jgi:hypothetical protein
VISPLAIDVKEGWANALEAVAKANCQAVTWNILRPHGNLDPMKFQGVQQVIGD